MRKNKARKSRGAERRKDSDLPALFVGLKEIFEQFEKRKETGATK